VLNNDNDLQSHIVSEHPNAVASDVRAGLVSQTQSSGAQVNVPQITDPLAAWGVTLDQVSALKVRDVSCANGITINDQISFLSTFGALQQPVVDPDVGAFLLEFFRYVLLTCASEDASNAGSFFLRDKSGGSKVAVAWSSFFSACKDHFSSQGLLFTPRKLMRTCEDVFWSLWNNPKVSALDDIRTHGSPVSKRFTMSDGRKPKAYVIVPELFSNRLTQTERECRLLHQSTVTKVAAGTDRPTYDGFDPEARNLALQAHRSKMENIIRNAGAGAGYGPGSDPRPRPWDHPTAFSGTPLRRAGVQFVPPEES
jgi:hypothetical protein